MQEPNRLRISLSVLLFLLNDRSNKLHLDVTAVKFL